MFQRLTRWFDYDGWANREALASIKTADTPPPRAQKIMAHIIAAEWLWMARLKMEKSPMAVWPELGLEQCEAQMAVLPLRWQNYLSKLTSEQLSQPINYTNTKGESFANSIEDILMHVLMHSAYHRGQIASDMRAAGHSPAYTDFIHAVRQGFVKQSKAE
jgi:uncharacterized damage-inducible protein DinB